LKCCSGAFRGRENSSEYHSLDQNTSKLSEFCSGAFFRRKTLKIIFANSIAPFPNEVRSIRN
jgi:hypothetical protein